MLVGRSEDIPGLVVEAATPSAIVEAIVEVAPHLLMANLGLSPEEVGNCLINVGPLLTKKRSPRRAPRPHVFVDSELVGAAA